MACSFQAAETPLEMQVGPDALWPDRAEQVAGCHCCRSLFEVSEEPEIDDLKLGQCKTWTQIANAATQAGGKAVKKGPQGPAVGDDAAELKASSGCANVKECK